MKYSVYVLMSAIAIMMCGAAQSSRESEIQLQKEIADLRLQIAQIQLERDQLKKQAQELRSALLAAMENDEDAAEAMLAEVRETSKDSPEKPSQMVVLTIRGIEPYPMQPNEAADHDRFRSESTELEKKLRAEEERLRKMEAENASVKRTWQHHWDHCIHHHDCSACKKKPTPPNSKDALSKSRLAARDITKRLTKARASYLRIERETKGRVLMSGEDKDKRQYEVLFTGECCPTGHDSPGKRPHRGQGQNPCHGSRSYSLVRAWFH